MVLTAIIIISSQIPTIGDETDVLVYHEAIAKLKPLINKQIYAKPYSAEGGSIAND